MKRFHLGLKHVAPLALGTSAALIALAIEMIGRAVEFGDSTHVAPIDLLLMRRAMLALLGALFAVATVAFMLLRRREPARDEHGAARAATIRLARHDALTGLPNRAQFARSLIRAIRGMRRDHMVVAVHHIDLDGFRQVNDEYGHACGDELIQAAARNLAASCRATDSFARLDGDVFAVIQTPTTVASASAFAARLVSILSRPLDLSVGRVVCGASIGVAVLKDPDVEPAEALRQAQLALAQAKRSGRGQFCLFDSQMQDVALVRRSLAVDLQGALARGDLEMVYQPRWNVSGAIIGLEAFARWRHLKRGVMPAAEFVAVAEESGLIETLGLFTLQRVFEDSRRWPDARTAINVSTGHLRLKAFASSVAILLSETGADASRFDLEIREDALQTHDGDVQETLRRLAGLGFRLTLDDCGTCEASLACLRRYPISRIKFDRHVFGVESVAADSQMTVADVVRLAEALHITVAAKGVETIAQRNGLVAAGCAEMQGYLFGKPLAAEFVAEFLVSNGEIRQMEVGDEVWAEFGALSRPAIEGS